MHFVKLVSIMIAVVAMTLESAEGQWQWLSNYLDTPEGYQLDGLGGTDTSSTYAMSYLLAMFKTFLQALYSFYPSGDSGSGRTKISLTYQLNVDSKNDNSEIEEPEGPSEEPEVPSEEPEGPSEEPEEPTGPCTPNPCLHAGECTVDGESDFDCECKDPLSGKTCEGFIYGCGGSEELDKIVCGINYPSGFDKDQEACKEYSYEGLVTIKDQKDFDFIKSFLFSYYTLFKMPLGKDNDFFEIGLKRDTAGDNKFKFPDNTPMDDSFQPFADPSDANNGDCVYISTKDTIKYYTGTCDASIANAHKVYYICEMKYPVAAGN